MHMEKRCFSSALCRVFGHWALSASFLAVWVAFLPEIAHAQAAEQAAEKELVLSEGSWMNVDVSPDGKTIVFDLLNDIYMVPSSGGTATLIHGGPAGQRSPRFDTSGKKIAFISDQSGADNIWVSNLDGSKATQISQETVHMVMGPAWSADGRKIAAAKIYATFDQMYASEIREFDIPTGKDTLIVATPKNERDVQEARYAPDGKYILYTERLVAPSIFVGPNHINYAVKRRHLETGKTETLLSGFGSATTPQISKDGKRVAFIRRVANKTVLFAVDLATREQWPVFDGLDRDLHADFVPQEHYYPAFGWFPDNEHVAIWAGGKIKKIGMVDGSIEDIPFTARATHRLEPVVRFSQDLSPEAFPVRIFRHLASAPGGDKILVRALGKLWQSDAGQQEPKRLTQHSWVEYEPNWSRDGKYIVYASWEDEAGSRLVIRNIDTGTEQILYQTKGIVREPHFSPDGQTIVFRIQSGDTSMGGFRSQAGLYLIAATGGAPWKIAKEGRQARFSQNGGTIVFTESAVVDGSRVETVQSMAKDGSNIKTLATAASPDSNHLALSPDGEWIAFKENQSIYVVPFKRGEKPFEVKAAGNKDAKLLSKAGGYEIEWSRDSQTVRWLLGASIFETRRQNGFAARSPNELALTAKTDVPEGRIAFTDARLITMKGDEVIEKGTVVVENNRIIAVGRSDRIELPRNAKIIDASGKTIMPGLIDAHGHIDCCYGTGVTPEKQPMRYAALAFGVTTNYDPYSTELTSYESKEMTLAGLTVGPRWMSSGSVIYGRARKPDLAYNKIDTLEDARATFARKAALGASIIKSYKQPARRQRQLLLAAAREQGIMVDAEGESHFSFTIGMILDGHTNIQHNLPIATYYDDVRQLFAASQVSHTPTLVVAFGCVFGENFIYQNSRPWEDAKVKAYVQETISGYSPLDVPGGAPPYVRGMTSIHMAEELWDVGFRSVARSVKRLDEIGVRINAGSHGQMAGIALHWELELMAEGGMSPLRILRTATINPAEAFGMGEHIGSLEVGKLADLIVLEKNPLENIKHTNSVRYTMINGRLYDSMTMNEIGNYDRPRTKFYWEDGKRPDIDWNEAWSAQ